MSDLLEQKYRKRLDDLLSQLPPAQRDELQKVAAAGAQRLRESLNDDYVLGKPFGWPNEPTAALIQTVRKEAGSKFYGDRYQFVLGMTADLLEEGLGLQTALIFSWVSYEVTLSQSPSKPQKTTPEATTERLA